MVAEMQRTVLSAADVSDRRIEAALITCLWARSNLELQPHLCAPFRLAGTVLPESRLLGCRAHSSDVIPVRSGRPRQRAHPSSGSVHIARTYATCEQCSEELQYWLPKTDKKRACGNVT